MKQVKNKKEKSVASVELILLQEKKTVLEKEIKANELSHKADLSKDFELLNKSNELLKTVCEKQSFLRKVESNVGEKKTSNRYQHQSKLKLIKRKHLNTEQITVHFV